MPMYNSVLLLQRCMRLSHFELNNNRRIRTLSNNKDNTITPGKANEDLSGELWPGLLPYSLTNSSGILPLAFNASICQGK